MARDTWRKRAISWMARCCDHLGKITVADTASEFEAIHAAGRAEGLEEARAAFAELDAVSGAPFEAGKDNFSPFRRAWDRLARALASDPVAGDQVAAGDELNDAITSAIIRSIRDRGMAPRAALGMAMSSLAGCALGIDGEGADVAICRSYLRHREEVDAPAPAPGLAAQEVERRLRDLVTCLLDNDPDDFAADGVTVLEVWRQAARAALSAPRPAQDKEGPTE